MCTDNRRHIDYQDVARHGLADLASIHSKMLLRAKSHTGIPAVHHGKSRRNLIVLLQVIFQMGDE